MKIISNFQIPFPGHQFLQLNYPSSRSTKRTLLAGHSKYHELFDGHHAGQRSGNVVSPERSLTRKSFLYSGALGSQPLESGQEDRGPEGSWLSKSPEHAQTKACPYISSLCTFSSLNQTASTNPNIRYAFTVAKAFEVSHTKIHEQ